MAEDLDINKVNGVEGIEESGDSENVSKPVRRVAKHDSGAADLEKVTDYEEEREISSQDIAGVGLRLALYLFFYLIVSNCEHVFIYLIINSQKLFFIEILIHYKNIEINKLFNERQCH